MTATARHTDPKSSHLAAQQLNLSGVLGTKRAEAARLVRKYPGNSYRFLYDKHVAESSAPGGRLMFDDACDFMKRLGEVADKDGKVDCPFCGGRRVTRWVPRN